MASHTRLPANIANSRALLYRIGPDGFPDMDMLPSLRDELTRALVDKAGSVAADSPLYEYFPGLEVQLPGDMQAPRVRRGTYPSQAQSTALRGPDHQRAVARAERAVRGTQDADPQAWLDVMRRWAALGEWDEVIRAVQNMPPDVAAMPSVVQAQALAWSRLGKTDSAIQLLTEHMRRAGDDDPESRGVLGSLYKKQHFSTHSAASLDAAIDQYRRAFAARPGDLYLGRNLVQLLHRSGTEAARAELATLLPDLRGLAASLTGEGVKDRGAESDRTTSTATSIPPTKPRRSIASTKKSSCWRAGA